MFTWTFILDAADLGEKKILLVEIIWNLQRQVIFYCDFL